MILYVKQILPSPLPLQYIHPTCEAPGTFPSLHPPHSAELQQYYSQLSRYNHLSSVAPTYELSNAIFELNWQIDKEKQWQILF